MKLENKDTFLKYRKQQEKEHLLRVDSNNPLNSLLTIEINTTELCNRRCVFCPRYDKDVYPNRNLNMSVENAQKIGENLKISNYKGKISFSGFSENFINKKFVEIVKVLRENLPDSLFECNTNGDFVTEKYVKNLYDAGLDCLYINLYDGIDQIDKFNKIMKPFSKQKYKYRAHYSEADYGLNLNNRGGSITWLGLDEDSVENLKGTPCYYPFYKMFVDWNGDVIFCSNDWQKEIKVGNMIEQTLEQVWLGKKLNDERKRLVKGDRTKSPCNKCSVNGQMFGQKSFNILKKYLA